MGYFEGLASGCFKTDGSGRTVFYPLGVLGRGRVLPDDDTERRIRAFLIRWYKITLPVLAVLGAIHLPLGILAALVSLAWLHITFRSLASHLPYSDSRLTLKESYTNSASSHNKLTLWILLLLSVFFVMLSLFATISARATEQRLVGAGSVVFFGMCSVAIGFVVRAKHASTRAR